MVTYLIHLVMASCLLLSVSAASSNARPRSFSSLIETNSKSEAKFGGSLDPVVGCVMCQYMIELIDRDIKSKPRHMNGNGYYPGAMDFGGGVQTGSYRTYPGSYIEENENDAPNMKTKVTDTKLFASLLQIRTGAAKGGSSKGGAAVKTANGVASAILPSKGGASTGGSSKGGASGGGSSKGGASGGGTSKGGGGFFGKGGQDGYVPSKPRQPLKGAFMDNDSMRRADQGAKTDEYASMYKDFFDALDHVCYRFLPENYRTNCKNLYLYGDAVVEQYLHGYENVEICTTSQHCAKTNMPDYYLPPQ